MSSTIPSCNTLVSCVRQVCYSSTIAGGVLTIPWEDYNSFKRELTNSLDADVPDLEELVKLKWDQYGQRFLQLCIGQKAVNLRSFSNYLFIPLRELNIAIGPNHQGKFSVQPCFIQSLITNHLQPSPKQLRRNQPHLVPNSNHRNLFLKAVSLFCSYNLVAAHMFLGLVNSQYTF
jgi:hypothetical protein